MRFHIIIPSIRTANPLFPLFEESLRASLTHEDTFIQVLDGSIGCTQALNLAMADIPPCDVIVKMDDDVLPPKGWQDEVVKALRIADMGAVGIECDDEAYMGGGGELPCGKIGDQTFLFPSGNIGGCLFAFRYEVLPIICYVPIIAETKYQYYEDGYRCMKLTQHRMACAYIRMDKKLSFVPYEDDPEYVASKARDLETARALLHTIWD